MHYIFDGFGCVTYMYKYVTEKLCNQINMALQTYRKNIVNNISVHLILAQNVC